MRGREEALLVLIGLILGAGLNEILWDAGRSKCEEGLPRNEHCVNVWKPEKEVK